MSDSVYHNFKHEQLSQNHNELFDPSYWTLDEWIDIDYAMNNYKYIKSDTYQNDDNIASCLGKRKKVYD